MKQTDDYNMREKTNRVQAKEEAPEDKLCRVQLEDPKSLEGRADKVLFVPHISAHLSHMLPDNGSQHHVYTCSNFPTQTSEGEVSLCFTCGLNVTHKNHQPTLLHV